MNATTKADLDAVIERMLEAHPRAEHHRIYCQYNRMRVVADADFLTRHLAGTEKILDVGAVPPLMLTLLHHRGFTDLHMADPFPDGFEPFLDKAGIGVHRVNLLTDDCAVLADAFDVVCLNEVIEHLSGNLVEALENVCRCVRRGGRLMVTTPNLRSLSGLAALLRHHSGLASKPKDTVREQYERESSAYGYYGHLREFTAREVIDLVESCGFTHIATGMQPSYLRRGPIMNGVARLERFVPPFRLFGKYLFEKPLSP